MSEESQYSDETNVGWIQWFCSIEDHQFFCEVNEDFIRNESNLYGLKSKVEKYNEALKMILRTVPPAQQEVEDPKQNANNLDLQMSMPTPHSYTALFMRGLAVMRERYLAGRFGTCPRVMCEKQNTLPIALNQDLKIARVKIYCPRCKDVYSPRKKSTDCDGAYFGTSFPFLLLMAYTDLKPFFKRQEFTPKIYGFKIEPHEVPSVEMPTIKSEEQEAGQLKEKQEKQELIEKPKGGKKRNKNKK